MRVPLLLVLAAATAAAAPQFPSPILPDRAAPVSAHVRVIRGFPNIAIITGDRGTLVVDTGLGPSNGATAARVARQLSKGRTLFLTTTHYHPEHAAGEGGFPPETIVIRPAVQQQEMIDHGSEMLTTFRRLSPEYAKLLMGVGDLRPPDIVFEKELRLDLGGGVTARLMWLGAAHTKGDEVILVDPDRTMITGDIVQNKVVPAVAGEGGSFTSWLAVLDQLAKLQPLHIVPDHSAPGDGSLIGQDRAFLSDMRSRALDLKKQGVSETDAARRLTDVFTSMYPEWAANPDWPNVNSIGGFVRRVYADAN